MVAAGSVGDGGMSAKAETAEAAAMEAVPAAAPLYDLHAPRPEAAPRHASRYVRARRVVLYGAACVQLRLHVLALRLRLA